MCSQSGSTSVAVVKGLTLLAVAAAEEIFLTQSGEQWQARVPLTTVGDLVLPEVLSRQVFDRLGSSVQPKCQHLSHTVTPRLLQVSSNLGPRGGSSLVWGNAEMDLPQEDRYQWRVFLCHVPLLPLT